MVKKSQPTVGLVWSQFAPYHVDRCEAVGSSFGEKARILAIEVATGSHIYAWEPSAALKNAEKVTLFFGRSYEDIPVLSRFLALLRATIRCDVVFFGIGYNELHIVLLALVLRILGRRVIVMTDSKFDDLRRRIGLEVGKSVILSVFHGALVAGQRQADYMRFLGFRRRPVVQGYDCIGIERVRDQARRAQQAAPPWEERPFLCVGRMVPKKNHLMLIEAYARYVELAGPAARRLVLVGSGFLEPQLRARAEYLGVADQLDMAGFLQAADVAGHMARSLALLLISTEEQWGLVVNEAVALSLPVIASAQVGACDLLVRNLINGYVVNERDTASVAQAMLHMGRDEKAWQGMREGASRLASKGDVAYFADAVKLMTST